MASSVEAQRSACVFLKPGAGYAVEMRVTSASWQTDWSGSFAIGGTKCQPLANLKSCASYTVEVKAIMGETKSCTPKVPYNPDYNSNTQAWLFIGDKSLLCTTMYVNDKGLSLFEIAGKLWEM